jgi:hypothetical protein
MEIHVYCIHILVQTSTGLIISMHFTHENTDTGPTIFFLKNGLDQKRRAGLGYRTAQSNGGDNLIRVQLYMFSVL